MHYNPELSEYGLTIEAQHLNPVACASCRTMLKIWPGWDWLFCENCRLGVSRVEIVKKTWLDAQSRAVTDIFSEYKTKIIDRRYVAEKVWDSLITGQEAEIYGQRTGPMGRYLRWVNSPGLLDRLESLTTLRNLQAQLPAAALRLEDLPGRLTGILLLWQNPSGKGYLSHTINVGPGPKVAFLEHTTQQQVAIKDPMLLVHVQARHFTIHDKYLPLIYADTNEPVWKPRSGLNTIMAVDYLLPKEIEPIARSGCMLHVHDPLSTSGKLSLTNAEEWYHRVVREASSWDMAISVALAKLSAAETASVLVMSRASQENINRIVGCYRHERRHSVLTAISSRPLEYRVSKSKTVFDDGVSWKSLDGSTVLSGSFRVLSVSRSDDQSVVYFCKIKTADKEIDFRAGKELERNAFQVILRECLLQGVNITFDRSYSKYAIEIATSLRPVQPAS